MSSEYILAIETSCDDTAIAVLHSDNKCLKILSNKVSSQTEIHAQWGGIVPNLAAREHVKNIPILLSSALSEAKTSLEKINLIAVTNGPGLIPALLVGTNFAKTLAYVLKKPLIGINHIEGHIYANWIDKTTGEIQNLDDIQFPLLCLLVSGGHTQLILMKDHLQYEIIGQTLDDAVGEAFDKTARILNLGYPGGPAVAQQAANFKTNLENKISLPRPMLKSPDFNFSFSGLKTATLYETKKNPQSLKDSSYVAMICHEFQQAAIDVLIFKTLKAAQKFNPQTILLAGGVSANLQLRKQLGEAIEKKLPLIAYHLLPVSLTGDNAAMIGAAAYFRWQKMTTAEKAQTKNNWKKLSTNANLKI